MIYQNMGLSNGFDVTGDACQIQASPPTRRFSRELGLLISALDRLGVPQSILVVELNLDIMISSTTIQASTLDAGRIRHDLQLSVQR